MDIRIVKLQKNDINYALDFIKSVIEDNFAFEGQKLGDIKAVITGEMKTQKDRLIASFKTQSVKFILAKRNQEIVGMIGFCYPGQTLIEAEKILNNKFPFLCELVTLYVKPELQKQGIGSLLLKEIMEVLKKSSYKYFGLSTGYKKGLVFWHKKFGDPIVVLHGYYYNEVDCHVWIREII
jgi:ribosomal protein S18 acetylase RimI-like enzyme